MKVLVATEKPFAPVAVEGIRKEVEGAGHELVLLEKYTDAAQLLDAVKDADALFVRTRTKCGEGLLSGSRVSFIATATIGTDHIDLEYCRRNGITVCNAPGCNAPAVAQYVFAVIGNFFEGESLQGLRLGVVGVGNVGSIVARWGERLGMDVMLCDPPRMRREGGDFVELERIAGEADIITFHTPLIREGIDRTLHLADDRFFDSLGHCRLLVNSSRGAVVDNAALYSALCNGKVGAAAVDCWENEPEIDRRLLDKAFVATPHIAGYSQEGKMRATAMIVEALNSHFGISAGLPHVSAPALGAAAVTFGRIMDSCNPLDDTERLKSLPEQFEQQRNCYQLRHEVL